MSLDSTDVAHILLALGVLLVAAHGCGHLFVRLRQPRVIGELTGGVLLGPTLLSTLAPGVHSYLFPDDGPTQPVLGACHQLGLLLLMFCSGAEMRSLFRRGEERTVSLVTVTGVLLPFLGAFALIRAVDEKSLLGPANNATALTLIFALALAVTSIPVIARIMLDLGILETSFARIVLGVAIVEDTIVYIVLSVALGLVATRGAEFGLPAVLGMEGGSPEAITLHVVATLVLFGVMLRFGGPAFRFISRPKSSLLQQSNPVAFHLVFMIAASLLAAALGITPLFGAFLAGIIVSTETGAKADATRQSIKSFSFAFFVPIYFAIVGLRLDLVHHFEPLFFLWFLLFASVLKAASVYLGARLAKESRLASTNLAVALNARGGPGIVLASVAFGAGIINEEFYAALIMLAVVTSMLAGSWLGRIVRRGTALRPEPARAAGAAPVLAAGRVAQSQPS
jgi:Kef-type K+ transport system membrane component KefB